VAVRAEGIERLLLADVQAVHKAAGVVVMENKIKQVGDSINRMIKQDRKAVYGPYYEILIAKGYFEADEDRKREIWREVLAMVALEDEKGSTPRGSS